ncbi:STAS domain-containing protein [Legionella micdadei]|uniref:Phospholipid transport system transporter-binding protein n=1 Tax=Legionella micdadei TaxID=451 RepID=A0A098GF06_LEGMI|nr:STAS domain-containing protein [Legionella micdadei]KTD28557.1 anti-anti-sigma factor [Legionella micdadei]CEG60550.1 putative anti-sigma-B factor antagonist (Anti-anti-sigma-B factor) [Legionella micdadei]SCX81358.1 phospholipid transport system transporter-binding protein [Legionella micdadei]
MQPQSFKPSPEMTFATVQDDCRRLFKFCHESKEAVLHLDLSEVLHCDSAGLALLIEARRLCKAQNKTCKIDGMPKAVQALAEFCGVDAMLEISAD